VYKLGISFEDERTEHARRPAAPTERSRCGTVGGAGIRRIDAIHRPSARSGNERAELGARSLHTAKTTRVDAIRGP
jgi:hypothetical protein